MGGALVIAGSLDVDLFRRSLEHAVSVHDVLRLRLHSAQDSAGGNAPMQEFLPAGGCDTPFEFFDYSGAAQPPLEAAMARVLDDHSRPMRLDQFPLHGDKLYRLTNHLHLWYPRFHHITNDAFGHSLIAATVARSYDELLQWGRLPELDGRSYADFIADDISYTSSPQFLKDSAFWRAKFPSMPEPLPFTARQCRVTPGASGTERCTLGVPRLVYDSVMRRADEAGVTAFHLLLAMLLAYLNRVTGQGDIVVGTPILNRANHAFRSTAGMFMNMMPLRVLVERDSTVFKLAAAIKAETRSCYRHQRFPLSEVLRHCRSLDGFCHGVFDVTVVYRKLDYGLTFGGAPMRVTTLDTGVRSETLSLEIDDYGAREDVNLFFNANPRLISRPELEQMAGSFELLLLDLAMDGDLPVRELRLSSGRPRRKAAERTSLPAHSIVDMVERKAIEAPESVAIACGGHGVTRGELSQWSNCVAAYLESRGCAPEEPVAVIASRTCDWIAAIIGIMKAGCAYLPLDPAMPRARIDRVLADSGCRVLLHGPGHVEGFEHLCTGVISEIGRRCPPAARLRRLTSRSLAYILYTSGTTGEPKGVLIEHGAIANTINELVRGWEVTEHDRVLEFASPMADASIVDVFLALCSGARLVIAGQDDLLQPRRLRDLLRREGVTIATLPPAYLAAMGDAPLEPLRLLITAGEAANPTVVARHLEWYDVVNAYGPTEAAVCASYLKLARGTALAAPRIPVGRPLGSTRIHILDEDLRPLPVGACGELCIAGAGLARGYLNRPELTARLFANCLELGERIYRTGDLGRVLADETIEFLGRRDAQLKIRGYRVEPGEVEAALGSHPDVSASAVAGHLTTGGLELVAYIVPSGQFQPRELRRYLAARLPAYMVPSRWLAMEALPITDAGKVDRAALPDAGLAVPLADNDGAAPPANPIERTLAGIWEEVLEVASPGRDDDFFELGGHSLKAVRILSRIQQCFGGTVEPAQFFSTPTIAGLASLLTATTPTARSGGGPIPVGDSPEVCPLSNTQARLWVLAQLEGGSAAYNMPVALSLEGPLDEDALESAFRTVISRHESLRTSIEMVDGVASQRVMPAADLAFALERLDLRSHAQPEEEARRLIQCDAARPFDLSRAPLLRATLLRIAGQRRLLSLVVHHIVADGWSLGVLLSELAAGYHARPLPPLALQYRHYAQWMASRLKNEELEQDFGYWRQALAAPLPVLDLPSDSPRPAVLGFDGAIERFALPRSDKLRLESLQASPFTVVLTAVFALLHRYTGEEDLIVGTPAANRGRGELENQIGPYVNTLPLRVGVTRGTSLGCLLQRVRDAVSSAQRHESCPFDAIVQELRLPRRTDRNPLFDVMVTMREPLAPAFRVPGLVVDEYRVPLASSVVDLTFHFTRVGGKLHLDLEYNRALFARPRIERMSRHLDRLIEALVLHPDVTIGDAEILPEEERRLILEEFAPGPDCPEPGRTVVELLAEQSRLHPARQAVVDARQSFTYAQLAGAAGTMACQIADFGISPGSAVAFIGEGSARAVAAIIGIMASGAACVAIDQSQPRERIERILADSACQAVVTDGGTAWYGRLPVFAVPEVVDIPAPLESRATLSGVAYIAYTSGSTGTPKGTPVGHLSLANLAAALETSLYEGVPRPAKELLLASIGFDVALKQIFGALTRGNTLVVPSAGERHDPNEWIRLVNRAGIGVLDLTPSHFTALLGVGFADAPKPTLRAIALGSEALPCSLVEEFARHKANQDVALYNFYGPSECTVEALYCRLDKAAGRTGIAPLGRPIANARAYVLDSDLRPAPIGIGGEICLGGLPVGRGYLNRPELEASRFVEDPFRHGERIYRTGDLGRWTADGVMEFLGRQDGQLKVRGYRVEPGEVEHHLLRHQGVSQAVVEGHPGPDGTTALVAYVVCAGEVSDAELRAFLRRVLPEAMVPSEFIRLAALPLSTNGKLDRLALAAVERSVAPATISAPRDGLELRLATIWGRVLRGRTVGHTESFFDAGGNSLAAVRLAAEIGKEFGTRIPVIRIFERPTIEGQASLLRESAEVCASGPLVKLRADGHQLPLVFLPGVAGMVNYLEPLATEVGRDRPIFSFQSAGAAATADRLEAVAEGYVDALLQAQPDGPYLLAGHSFGGVVAFAMAQVLLGRGREVGLLALVDSPAPGSGGDEPTVDTAGLLARLLPEGVAEAPPELLVACTHNLRLLQGYAPEFWQPLEIHLIRAQKLLPGLVPLGDLRGDWGWSRFAAHPVEVISVPGDHDSMLRPPHVSALARTLRALLALVSEQAEPVSR
jgi:amino acid adenylation domain-containing protein